MGLYRCKMCILIIADAILILCNDRVQYLWEFSEVSHRYHVHVSITYNYIITPAFYLPTHSPQLPTLHSRLIAAISLLPWVWQSKPLQYTEYILQDCHSLHMPNCPFHGQGPHTQQLSWGHHNEIPQQLWLSTQKSTSVAFEIPVSSRQTYVEWYLMVQSIRHSQAWLLVKKCEALVCFIAPAEAVCNSL